MGQRWSTARSFFALPQTVDSPWNEAEPPSEQPANRDRHDAAGDEFDRAGREQTEFRMRAQLAHEARNVHEDECVTRSVDRVLEQARVGFDRQARQVFQHDVADWGLAVGGDPDRVVLVCSRSRQRSVPATVCDDVVDGGSPSGGRDAEGLVVRILPVSYRRRFEEESEDELLCRLDEPLLRRKASVKGFGWRWQVSFGKNSSECSLDGRDRCRQRYRKASREA